MATPQFTSQTALDPNTLLALAAQRDNENRQLEFAEKTLPFGTREREIARQQKLADELRGTEMPTGLNPTGKVFTKASPLEFAATTANRYVGQQKDQMLTAARMKQQQQLAEMLRQQRADSDRNTQLLLNRFLPQQGMPMPANDLSTYTPFQLGA